MKRTRLAAVLLLTFSCLANWVSAEQTTSNLSPEDLYVAQIRCQRQKLKPDRTIVDSEPKIRINMPFNDFWHRHLNLGRIALNSEN